MLCKMSIRHEKLASTNVKTSCSIYMPSTVRSDLKTVNMLTLETESMSDVIIVTDFGSHFFRCLALSVHILLDLYIPWDLQNLEEKTYQKPTRKNIHTLDIL